MTRITGSMLVLLLTTSTAWAEGRNVILMISDGAGFGTWDMGSLQQTGQRYSPAVVYNTFPAQYLMTTYPLNTSGSPTGGHVQLGSYDPAKAWDTTANATHHFNGYQYVKSGYTDSAAAGTALSTGVKTYNSAINWDNDPAGVGKPLTSIFEIAHDAGKATGSVTSVQWSHATPAAFGSHNIDRGNYSAIANEMLSSGKLDVIMGAGNPDYNANGVFRSSGKDYQYVGGSTTWTQLKAGTHAGGWTLVESKAGFESLMSGPTPGKVVGTAQVYKTLQQERSGYSSSDAPFADPFISTVPTLSTLSKAALNVLNNKSAATGDKGFFVMIEGGAVDWAAHSNQTSRVIEEQVDFNLAVQAAHEWVEANSSWEETLLIVTTDHANGLPMGPASTTTPFDRIELGDIGASPTVRWHTGNHTNELVPVFAKGAGSELFGALVDGTDPHFGTYFGDWAGFDGRYVDNTDVFSVMFAATVPEPASAGLLVLGAAGLLQRRRVRL